VPLWIMGINGLIFVYSIFYDRENWPRYLSLFGLFFVYSVALYFFTGMINLWGW
jgi:hypothetical protein